MAKALGFSARATNVESGSVQRQFQCRRFPTAAERGRSVAHVHDRRRKVESELGRQIPVDLQADADLNENRGGPGH